MRRLYISPVTDIIPLNPTSVLCASGTPSTSFGVNNNANDNLIIQ